MRESGVHLLKHHESVFSVISSVNYSILLIVIALLAGCASEKIHPETTLIPVEAPQRLADYSGHWELDYKLTENPHDKLQWLYEVARSQVDQNRRRDQNNQPSPQTVRAINDLNGVINLGRFTESMTRSTLLEIDHAADYVMVKRDGDYALTCDFMNLSQDASPLGEERCGYDRDGSLVFLVSLPEGLTVRNRLTMSNGGKRLNVATTFVTNELKQPFTLNKVYMPYVPGGGQFKCEYSLEKKKICWLGDEAAPGSAKD